MNRQEIEEKVTQAVIDRLESGTAPWSRPWVTDGWLPTSLASGKPYRGINSLLLSAVAVDKGFESPLWATYRQVAALGGQVRRGESATPVVLWKRLTREERIDGELKQTSFPLLRYFNVFNVGQVDGIEVPSKFLQARDSVSVPEAVASVLASYRDGPTIQHVAQGRAFYSPSTDSITLPTLEQFNDSSGYAATLFHELTHSTGHRSRLDRFTESSPFGCETYAKEELVAEMGASLLAATVGVEFCIDATASYVSSWLSALNDDRSLIIKAAQQAQKSVDRIVGYDASEQVEEEEKVAA